MCGVDKFCWLVDDELISDPKNDIGKLSEQAYADAIKKIQSLPKIRDPSAKRSMLEHIYNSIVKSVKDFNSKNGKTVLIMSDNLIPIIEFLVIRSGTNDIYTELCFIEKTIPPSSATGPQGFMITTFKLCIDIIKDLNSDDVLINEIAHANTENNTKKLWELLYDGLNTPNSFLNRIFARIVDKYIIDDEDKSSFSRRFREIRDSLANEVNKALIKNDILINDENAVVRACRDVTAKIVYDNTLVIFEKDKAIKTLNERINSEINAMKDILTFEMIDPLHRNIDINTRKIEKLVVDLMSKKKPITKQMETLSKIKTLICIENGGSVVGLAFIRAGVQDIVVHSYLFNAFITEEEEAIEAHRVLIEAEASVERMDTIWRYTDVIREKGWNRDTATKSAYLLLSNTDNAYGRSADSARKKISIKKDKKNLSDMLVDITNRVVHDMVGWFPIEKGDEEWEAVYNAAEMTIIGPNFSGIMKVYADAAKSADNETDEIILRFSSVAHLGMFGVGLEYSGRKRADQRVEREVSEKKRIGLTASYENMNMFEREQIDNNSVETYSMAICAIKSIKNGENCTCHKMLEVLKSVLDLIYVAASESSKKAFEEIGEDVIIGLLGFVIVRSKVTGLNGLRSFMNSFLDGSKRWSSCLTKFDGAINMINNIAYNPQKFDSAQKGKMLLDKVLNLNNTAK